LAQLSGGSDSIFHQVTPDGSVFVGSAIDSGSNSVAIRWDATNEFSVIPGNGGVVPEEATGVSNDAQVIVGAAATASSQFIEAFRWTSTNGTAGLGFLGGLAGSRESAALDVSADGNTVVGYSSAGAGIGVFEAFIWNPSAGLRSLESELNARGAAIPAGWTLQSAVGVSADGNTIIGGGFNPSGNFQGWVATLPEPSISLALGLGVLLLSSLAPNRK
jgi:probable HAF family extracellular repeat protein